MKFSRSRKRTIQRLEEEVQMLRRDLNVTMENLGRVADNLINTRQLLRDYTNSQLPTSSRMCSSSADTGSGPGDITPTSDGTTSDDTSGVIPASASNPSRETGVHDIHGCGTTCWCGYDDTDHHVRAYHEGIT
jgi:hypothetical protein